MTMQRHRNRWAAIGAAVAVTLGGGGLGIASAASSSGERAIFAPIEPCRLADTRPSPFTVGPRLKPIGPAETYTLDGRGSVGSCTLPTDATALTLNVTAVGATAPTFLTLFPGNATPPNASHLNPVPGAPPTPNAVTVDLDGSGRFSVFNRFGSLDVIVDVVGVFRDHNHDDRYYTRAQVDDVATLKPGTFVDGTANPAVLRVRNTGPSGGAIRGETTGNGQIAIRGIAINSDTGSTGIGVFGQTFAPFGTAVAGNAESSTGANFGVIGGSASPDGYGGWFEADLGVALYATNAGGAREKPALRVDNTNTTNGMAAYLTNDSEFATGHFGNGGSGQVLWLQNGGTDVAGTGGGDFITAVNDAENDAQFRVLTSGDVRSDGTFASPAADFAELLPGVDGLEPGDVLAIGPDGLLTRSTSAAQTTVVGVHSTGPAFLGGQPVDSDPTDHVPLAVVGVVPVKVSAENGAIAPGDLLVSASIAGHAMRAGADPAIGTVIGKALAPLTSGTGMITALIVLQ